MKNYQRAVADYTDGIKLNSKDALLFYHRGWTYSILGNKKQAKSDYNKALKLNRALVQILTNYTIK